MASVLFFFLFVSYICLFTEILPNTRPALTRLAAPTSICIAIYTSYIMCHRVRFFKKVAGLLYSTKVCCFAAHKARGEKEEDDVPPVQTEEKLSNFITIADGGMTQQPMKISLMTVSYYPLNNSRIHRNDPFFYQLQERRQYNLHSRKFRGNVVSFLRGTGTTSITSIR